MPVPIPSSFTPGSLVVYSGSISGYVQSGAVVSNNGSTLVIAWADESLAGNYFALSVLDPTMSVIQGLSPSY